MGNTMVPVFSYSTRLPADPSATCLIVFTIIHSTCFQAYTSFIVMCPTQHPAERGGAG